MSNYNTIQAITKNLEGVLSGLGIKFSPKTFDDAKSIPASLIPLGEIFYNGESFESIYGERPSYIEAEYNLRVTLSERDSVNMMRSQQKWVHLIRGGLTVNALNIGDLASSKLISRVKTEAADAANDNGNGIAVINYRVSVRYREL